MNEEKYKGIYRILSARWRERNYGANAVCFVTVCTAHREHFCGETVWGDGDISVAAVPVVPVEMRCIASPHQPNRLTSTHINRIDSHRFTSIHIDRINFIDCIDFIDRINRIDQIDRTDAKFCVSTCANTCANTLRNKQTTV